MGAALIWGYNPATDTWVPVQVDASGILQVNDPVPEKPKKDKLTREESKWEQQA